MNGDRGIVQISRKYHPEVSDECAFDPDCALDWAAMRISKGYCYEWVVCNCYLYVEAILRKDIPMTKDLKPNSTPHKGAVVIYHYFDSKGNIVPHYAVQDSESMELGYWERGTNLEPAKPYRRFVLWTNPSLRGFYKVN